MSALSRPILDRALPGASYTQGQEMETPADLAAVPNRHETVTDALRVTRLEHHPVG